MQGQFWKNFPEARAPESRGVATAETGARGADADVPGASGPLDARLSPRGAPRGLSRASQAADRGRPEMSKQAICK